MSTGPLPRFTELHVRAAGEIIAERGRISRKELGKKLGVGEGSVRTILNILKQRGFVTSSRGGHALTAKGRKWVGEPPELVKVNCGGLTVGKVDVATVVRGGAGKVKKGVEQRDEAMKAGALGATVLVFQDSRLRFPDDATEVGGSVGKKLVEALKLKEGDVVVIGTADDEVRAEMGARAAARSLR